MIPSSTLTGSLKEILVRVFRVTPRGGIVYARLVSAQPES